jgi:predicted PurR-regulated permease PerM
MKIDKDFVFPLYAKISLVLIGIYVFVSMLYITKGILVPFVFALLIAILLYPVVQYLMRFRLNRIISIVVAIFVGFLIIASVSFLLISQVSRLSESWPEFSEKFSDIINQAVVSIGGVFDVNPQSVQEWLTETKTEFTEKLTSTIGKSLVIVGNGLVVVLLLPVYVFLILYYQPLLVTFILRLFTTEKHNQVSNVISKIKSVIQNYLFGLIIETGIVATLQIAALLFLGIDYAILLGVLGALLNLIPYIGGIVGVALPMMVAVVSESNPSYALYVLIIYYVIQLIDNNYIVPVIVASKVKINALISIVAVLAGNALWGIPGMFLSLPIIAIMKLIFDHVESLNPWGFLLGDTKPDNFYPTRSRFRHRLHE